MTIKERINQHEAELEAAYAEHEAARTALDAYEMNPSNWKRPDYQERWNELYEAIGTAADKAREIGKKLDEAKKELFATSPAYAPMRNLMASLKK
jgi:chromosome segregation ATPase